MATTPTSSPAPRQFYRRVLPESCIAFHSAEGKQIFREALIAGYMDCYFGLAAQFRTQDEPSFCGLSTLVMVLNTLEVDPKKVWKGVWRWYHENMLDCCVPLDVAAKSGVTFDQFACLASCNTLDVNMVRANESSEEAFREIVKQLTQQEEEVIVASYHRGALNQTGFGHFSPIGGYHPERDLVLILDTARFKYPPHWVSLSLLWEAMRLTDNDTGLCRGYMRMRKSGKFPMILFRISDDLTLALTRPNEKTDSCATIEKFLNRWFEWCGQPCSSDGGCEPGRVSILDEAIKHVIHALQELTNVDGLAILTTQTDIKCPKLLSEEHSCAVGDIILALESTRIYKMIVEYLAADPSFSAIASTAGHAVQVLPCKKQLPSHSCTNPKLQLSQAHFLTTLLLAWPGHRCGGCKTNGTELMRAVRLELSSADLSVQNEIYLLNTQLQSLFGYKDKCDTFSVNCCGRSSTCKT